MNTRLRPLALLVLALTSCTAKNDSSIEVYAICAPPDDAEKCATSGECEMYLMGRPWVTTRRSPGTPPRGPFQNDLTLPVQVNNQLPRNEDPDTFRLNTHDFTIEEYRLSFTSTPPLSIPSLVVQANQIVPAESSSTPFVPIIPWEAMAAIDAQNPVYTDPNGLATVAGAVVEVEMRVFGHTRDGSEIETAPWVVPVDVLDEVDFDPVCTTSGEIVTASCPHIGQPSTFACAAP